MGRWTAVTLILMACLLALGFIGGGRWGVAFLARLRASGPGSSRGLRGPAGALIVAGASFLLVTGIGAVASYLVDLEPPSLSRSGSNGEMFARLKDYARSIETDAPASVPAAGKPLPDVDTMIERLAARLESTPEDIKGWRMLGWSYFHTARYQQAASAYARAVELDPNSSELKLSYEAAKAKASESEGLQNR